MVSLGHNEEWCNMCGGDGELAEVYGDEVERWHICPQCQGDCKTVKEYLEEGLLARELGITKPCFDGLPSHCFCLNPAEKLWICCKCSHSDVDDEG